MILEVLQLDRFAPPPILRPPTGRASFLSISRSEERCPRRLTERAVLTRPRGRFRAELFSCVKRSRWADRQFAAGARPETLLQVDSGRALGLA
jgi:hypothetical protein